MQKVPFSCASFWEIFSKHYGVEVDEISSALFKVLKNVAETSATLICALMFKVFFTLQYFGKFVKKSFYFIEVPWHPLLLYIYECVPNKNIITS